MNHHAKIIQQLTANWQVFEAMLVGLDQKQVQWSPHPQRWNLLEILCHLVDEEREDFRARVKHVLETPDAPMPSIDPEGWIQSRHYRDQSYEQKLGEFLEERAQSVAWLQSLQQPKWRSVHLHPRMGEVSAEFFLANWLAHDFHHIRQINRVKYEYLHSQLSDSHLDYAGIW